MRIFLTAAVFFSSAILFVSCTSIRKDGDDSEAWGKLLSDSGFTRENCRIDQLDMANWGGDKYVLPFFTAMHGDPLRIPFYVTQLRDNAISYNTSCGNAIISGGGYIGAGSRINLIGNPLLAILPKDEENTEYLLNSIGNLCETGKGKKEAPPALREKVKNIPPDIQRQAGLLVHAISNSIWWRNEALKNLSEKERQRIFSAASYAEEPYLDGMQRGDLESIVSRTDFKYLVRGAEELGFAIDSAVAELSKRSGNEDFSFEWQTEFGKILINGTRDDTYPADAEYLLIIDAGGNETYYGGGATRSVKNPASVIIDLAGNDSYLGLEVLKDKAVADLEERKTAGRTPSFGAGILGYGLLVDVSGNDTYKAFNNTQGSGQMGVGLLQDRAGDDIYDCYANGQGSATFGVGILADLAGSDKYFCFRVSQGAGQVKGAGLLVDTGNGNDTYLANDTKIDSPSPQTKEHNANLSQGAGFGWRADYIDAHSLAGGVGVLIDDGGDNEFSCGVFGQGTGYWHGVGVLCSGKGNDRYRGVWYAQGSGVHFATGAMLEDGGNDTYITELYSSLGAGNDFSVGFMIDNDGNDVYSAGYQCLGSGYCNGFGFFWDRKGDDKYSFNQNQGKSMGYASTQNWKIPCLRDRNITAGFFPDTAGNDQYPEIIKGAKNNSSWKMEEPKETFLYPVLRGNGLDTEAPDAKMPW